MAEFERLQQLWQRQPERAMAAGDAAGLSDALRRYGRRHDLIYLGKATVIGCLLMFLLSLLRQRPLAAFGASLAVFSGVLFLISDWRTQRAIARLNFAAPSVEFVRNAIARLRAQRNPFGSREFSIAMGGCWVGVNLIVASHWSSMTVYSAVAAHGLVTAIPFGVYALGRWIRGKRFERECRPLIERLERAIETMEAGRV